MKNLIFYFANLTLILAIFVMNSCTNANNTGKVMHVPDHFDWQGHRGCRGLMPENSIEGFIHALQFPIQTLELDVVLSRDEVVIVSHEPWFSEEICACEGLETKNIFEMNYDEIKKVDCGSKPHPRFPNQSKLKTHKPSLIEVVTAVRKHCEKENLPFPAFNIELKSQPEWDGVYLPGTRTFVERVYQTIRGLGIEENTTIQSFDPRVMNTFMAMQTQLQFAFLTEETGKPLVQMEVLDKLPQIYSPYFKNINSEEVVQLQKMKIRVIPWTVNDKEDMKSLLEMGVNGIITDYPNLIGELLEDR